ncbi:MAG TPA: cupin-like domain-containing protein [Chitinophagales bacterium]|nr:cupin-like domain-containing protein [Chitinophagales bacterium]
MKPTNVTTTDWWTYNALFLAEHFLGEKWYNKLFGAAEKKLFNKIDMYASTYPNGETFKILDYKKGTWTEPLGHPYYPKIFRGAASEWGCCKKWSFDYFAEQYGNEDVVLINNPGLVKDTDQAYDVIKLRDYIKNLKAGSKQYLKFSRIVDEKSELRNDFDVQWLRKFKVRFAQNELFYFFMGGKDTLTPIHDGFATTVFVQVTGTKRWIFYDTNNRLFIHARPRRYNYFYSEADPHNLNDPKFPLLKHARQHEVILNAGDVLYFPSFVWHQVENVTDTIGMAYKFAALLSGFTSSKMLATCFLLATKPWLIETMLPWRPDTYNYKSKL